jgi:hypothetical protein
MLAKSPRNCKAKVGIRGGINREYIVLRIEYVRSNVTASTCHRTRGISQEVEHPTVALSGGATLKARRRRPTAPLSPPVQPVFDFRAHFCHSALSATV